MKSEVEPAMETRSELEFRIRAEKLFSTTISKIGFGSDNISAIASSVTLTYEGYTYKMS